MNEFNHEKQSASVACGFTEEEKSATFALFDDVSDILTSEMSMSKAVETIETLFKDSDTDVRQLIYALIKAYEFMIYTAAESTNSAKKGAPTITKIVGNG